MPKGKTFYYITSFLWMFFSGLFSFNHAILIPASQEQSLSISYLAGAIIGVIALSCTPFFIVLSYFARQHKQKEKTSSL